MPNTSISISTTAPALQIHDLPRSFVGRALLAIGATAFIAICAHVSVPLYFTPVPVTLQTFAVLVIGLLFGPALAASTLLLYLAEGMAGLPVFSPAGPGGIAQLLGPTGGFLLSYPLAAALAGGTARKLRSLLDDLSAAVIASAAATTLIFAIGASWTAHWLHLSAAGAWHVAVLPFLPGEGLKIAAAAAILTSYSRWRRSE
jgi:biotin transport system substrate-specific component